MTLERRILREPPPLCSQMGEPKVDFPLCAVMYHYWSYHCTVSFLLAGKHLWSLDLWADPLSICARGWVRVLVWNENLWCLCMCGSFYPGLHWCDGWSEASLQLVIVMKLCESVCVCVCMKGGLTGLDYPLQSCPPVWKLTHAPTHTLTTASEMMNVGLSVARSSRDPTCMETQFPLF